MKKNKISVEICLNLPIQKNYTKQKIYFKRYTLLTLYNDPDLLVFLEFLLQGNKINFIKNKLASQFEVIQ